MAISALIPCNSKIESTKFCYRRENGRTSNDLMTTNVSVIPRSICDNSYQKRIGKHSFCAGSMDGGRDTCQVRSFIICFIIEKLIDFGNCRATVVAAFWPIILWLGLFRLVRNWIQKKIKEINKNDWNLNVTETGIGCGRPFYPGIYLNVHHYNHWIRQVISSTSYSIPSNSLILATIAVIIVFYWYLKNAQNLPNVINPVLLITIEKKCFWNFFDFTVKPWIF